MKTKLAIIFLFLFFSSIGVLAEENNKLPKWVKEYLYSNKLKYTMPQGNFDKYLVEFYQGEGHPVIWYIIDDFNGDNKKDFAGFLRTVNGTLDVVVIFSAKRGYNHTVLVENISSDNSSVYNAILVEPPGRVESFPFDNLKEEERSAQLKYPGIHIIYFERAAVLYYWKDGKFTTIQTSD